MKKILFFCLSAVLACSAGLAFAAPRASKNASSGTGDGKSKAFFVIYTDQQSMQNHYAPSGWMGDYGDIKLNNGCLENPKTGKSCIKITYNAKGAQGAGWCGIYWQYPPNNWGEKKGYNLTGAKKLTFWARGASGGERISEFKVGGLTGSVPDTDSNAIGPIELEKSWKQYTIDLTGKDLSNICGGFAFSASRDDNPDGMEMYFDEIVFE
ncbi:MAG: hypothetical protein ABII64_05430 [Elusimicrobiota bacterium]